MNWSGKKYDYSPPRHLSKWHFAEWHSEERYTNCKSKTIHLSFLSVLLCVIRPQYLGLSAILMNAIVPNVILLIIILPSMCHSTENTFAWVALWQITFCLNVIRPSVILMIIILLSVILMIIILPKIISAWMSFCLSVILPNVIQLIIIRPSGILMGIIVLKILLLKWHFDECQSYQCRDDECHSVVSLCLNVILPRGIMLKCHYA
jgi:hypothetical protein